MHLLVLSAFRLVREESGRLCRRRRVSMHLLVLSAFRPTLRLPNTFALQVSMHLLVLSAFRQFIAIPDDVPILSLNAPFGAQCFPTGRRGRGLEPQGPVSMHLLVLSAFRRIGSRTRAWRSYVSMHLLVLSAFRLKPGYPVEGPGPVSMHLLVLSAFRPRILDNTRRTVRFVSMHLLVLSAFRHRALRGAACGAPGLNAPFGAQCFPTSCSEIHSKSFDVSQCTFWCSVLSDRS